MNTIDARGLSCPQPVLLTKKAMMANDSITVLVDNNVAFENISRYAKNSGFALSFLQDGEDFSITINK